MATIADVAQRAAVSKGTVSKVLNNKMEMSISPATIERIKRAAEELGYRPSALGRALATRRTNTIGLYYAEMTDPHFARLLGAVQRKARDRGYHLLVTADLTSIGEEGRVDGAILVLPRAHSQPADPVGRRPVAIVGDVSLPRPNRIGWNDFEAGQMAARYLLDLGHRGFAVIVGDHSSDRPLPRKIEGFLTGLRDRGATWHECWGAESPDQIENGYLLTRAWLREKKPGTALFARNDLLALGAMKALREAGLAIPREVSVIGHGDTILARCATPELTSVSTPLPEAGALAMEQLLMMIDRGETEFQGVVLPAAVMERGSCAPPPSDRD